MLSSAESLQPSKIDCFARISAPDLYEPYFLAGLEATYGRVKDQNYLNALLEWYSILDNIDRILFCHLYSLFAACIRGQGIVTDKVSTICTV